MILFPYGLTRALRSLGTRPICTNTPGLLLTSLQVDPVARQTTIHFIDTHYPYLTNVTSHNLHLSSRCGNSHLDAAVSKVFKIGRPHSTSFVPFHHLQPRSHSDIVLLVRQEQSSIAVCETANTNRRHRQTSLLAAPSDDMKIIRSQGEAQTTLVVRGARADLTSPVTNHKTAPCYLDLPPDVRNQILTEVINAARGDFGEVKPGNPGSTMALVSKVWQHDVEQILFGEISIDPADTQQVAMFKKVFIDERKKYLKRLDIDITNHDKDEGQEKSLVRAAKAMARIGQFLTYINGWDFGKRSLEIVFKTFDLPKDRMVLEPKDKQRLVPINSPLDEYHLDIATKGGNPADMPLRAISQEFPMSLDMVTHLSITPDILPSLAVKKILQTMPNLQTCFLNIRFPADCSASWQVFSGELSFLRVTVGYL